MTDVGVLIDDLWLLEGALSAQMGNFFNRILYIIICIYYRYF